MNHESVLIPQRMRTPRAAAIAGIIFSLLFIASMLLIWTSIPADPRGAATDVMNHLKALSFSLNLLPFAGVAFLWFVAVVRDRLGELEDRLFATVFLGSGQIYSEYDAELIKLNDLRVANIQNYASSYTQMTDEKADELIRNGMAYRKQRYELLENTTNESSRLWVRLPQRASFRSKTNCFC